ncbi:MAG: putative 3-oxoacyl-[acyl-carrier-protein] reductase [Deltaproteobacteria bacterium]|nr:putative 3-oxoacyl-[acyl-carrier-protein] reductase [Deltaproteobacteria bacterium]
MGEHVKGKNAIVTGSSHGVGRAVALALAAEGANVVVNGSGASSAGLGTDLGPLNDTVEQIVARGGVALASCGSVADFDYAGKLIATCSDNFGSIDILVNCAGIPEVGSIVDVPPETWRRVVDVHLHGTFNCCRHAAPLMAKRRRGRIINTGSHAFLGIYGGTGYAASKGGIVSLTRAMAHDMAEFGVTCNVFCPGAKTRLSSGEEYEEKIRALFAKGWLNEARRDGGLHPPPAECVAPLVVYLASDAAANITGQVFVIAGGYVGLFPEPKEECLAWRDYSKDGPWSVDELAALLPAQLGVGR